MVAGLCEFAPLAPCGEPPLARRNHFLNIMYDCLSCFAFPFAFCFFLYLSSSLPPSPSYFLSLSHFSTSSPCCFFLFFDELLFFCSISMSSLLHTCLAAAAPAPPDPAAAAPAAARNEIRFENAEINANRHTEKSRAEHNQAKPSTSLPSTASTAQPSESYTDPIQILYEPYINLIIIIYRPCTIPIKQNISKADTTPL